MKSKIKLKHGSLFSGIGGFDLAAEYMGWENIFHCEMDPFCKRVLNYYYPKTESNDDIRKTDFQKYKGRIDILTGGFPCQPYSLAGKRMGKEDPRHLWPEMLRAVREIQPRWVVGENVRGLISWNGGLVFDEVQSDLEAAGYSVLPFLLPAAGVNAPHKRERIWFIAYSESDGSRGKLCRLESADGIQRQPEECRKDNGQPGHNGKVGTTTHANNREQQEQPERSAENRRYASEPRRSAGTVTGAGDRVGHITERVRQLAAGAGFLQTPATDTASIGRGDGSDHRIQRPVQTNSWLSEEDKQERQRRQRRAGKAGSVSSDTNLKGLEGKTSQRVQTGTRGADQHYDAESAWNGGAERWNNFPETEPIVRIGNDGLSNTLDLKSIFEGIPFPVKPISFSKWRTESIKALGNAIVPQVAIMLFTVIQTISNEF